MILEKSLYKLTHILCIQLLFQSCTSNKEIANIKDFESEESITVLLKKEETDQSVQFQDLIQYYKYLTI